jgi:hypothetical protein
MSQRIPLTAAALCAAALFGLGTSAWAVDKTWTGATSSDWLTASNWSGGLPASVDRAILPAPPLASGRYPVLGAGQSTSISQLLINTGATLAIQDGATLTLNGYASPLIDGGGVVSTPSSTGQPFGTGQIAVTDTINAGLSTSVLFNVSVTVGNMFLSYNGGGNVNSVRMIVSNPASVRVNGYFNVASASVQLGQNPNATVTELNVRGDLTISNRSIVNFKTNGSILHCGGNWTQTGQRLRSGTGTLVTFDGSGNQSISQNNGTLSNVTFENVTLEATGAARTVTWLNNPALTPSFGTTGDFIVGANVTFVLQDGVAGIGSGTANTFRIESGATADFQLGYTCAASLLFQDRSTGASSNGTLRMENAIAQFAGAFTSGLGTVEYAGNGVAQAVTCTLGSYYNLVIDTKAGVAATQQAAALGVNATLTIGKTVGGSTNTAAIFTAAATNVTVGDDFVCNGVFNNGSSTVILTCSLDHAASVRTDVASPVALTFNNLTVSASATATSMDVVTAARNFSVANAFTIPRGKLTLSSGVTVDAQKGITVGDNVLPAGATSDSELELIGNVTFRVGATFTLGVQPDGIFFAGLRSSATAPIVTRIGGSGTFSTSLQGVVDVTQLNFSFGNVNGLNINTTAAKVNNLRNITFAAQDASLAGLLPADLTVNAPGINFDCPGCFFGSLVAGGVNVRAKGAGTNMILRFEDRGATPPGGGGGGPGAGEARDDDDDLNANGVIDAGETAGGSIVQWVYTINLDVPGAIQGFPEPAFDWNTFAYYSTYAMMRNSSGTTDTLYVLNTNGDLLSYSFSLPAVDMVGPAYWTTEGTTHVVYIGTSDGRVFKLIDTGSALATPPAPWDTPFSAAALTAVTSPVISDGTNIYFAGQSTSAPNFGVFKVAISTKTMPNAPLSIGGVRLSSGFAWVSTPTGRLLYGASNALGGVSYIGRAQTATWTIDAVYSDATTTSDFLGYVNPMNTATDITVYLYAGESNGYVHAVNAAGTPAAFATQRPGFPFRDKTSAVQGGVIVDHDNSRVFFGNAAGDIYTLKSFTGAWTLNSNYFRFGTPGGAPIATLPLFQDGILYVSSTAGKVFCLDADNGAGGQTLVCTFNLGTSALGDVSRDFTTSRIYVATAGGRLYSIPTLADPTPGAP